MKQGVYSCLDRKAALFSRPFVVQNHAVALRAFEAAKQDPSSEISKFPTDFELYHVGYFDDDTGVVTGVVPTVVVPEV